MDYIIVFDMMQYYLLNRKYIDLIGFFATMDLTCHISVHAPFTNF